MDKQTEEMFAVMQMRIDSLEKKFDTPIVRANNGVDNNTSDISDNSLGLFDVAALADENSQAIMDLAELIAEKDGE